MRSSFRGTSRLSPAKPDPVWRAVLGTLVLFAAAQPSPASAQPPKFGPSAAVPRQIGYNLTVTSITPDRAVEFSPVTVSFSLNVTSFGVTGPAPSPAPIDVCPTLRRPQTTCYHIAAPVPGRTYKGQVTALAPWAGQSAPLKLVALTRPRPPADDAVQVEVSEASRPMISAARYDVALEGFDILSTRSTSTDTVWVNLQGLVKANPAHPSAGPDACDLAAFAWCVLGKRYGDAQDGHHVLTGVRVGSYQLVPEQEDELRFLVYMYNFGDTPYQEIGEAVANGFATVGMVILGAYQTGQGGSTSSAAQLNDVMTRFHGSAFASCDGPLVSKVVVVPNKAIDGRVNDTLDGLTRATGAYRPVLLEEFREKDSDVRCDRRGSKYRINYAVRRTSWVPWAP